MAEAPTGLHPHARLDSGARQEKGGNLRPGLRREHISGHASAGVYLADKIGRTPSNYECWWCGTVLLPPLRRVQDQSPADQSIMEERREGMWVEAPSGTFR